MYFLNAGALEQNPATLFDSTWNLCAIYKQEKMI